MSVQKFFLLFMIYSMIGWTMEVICKLIEKHKFINRGFLIGPYCSIYGWGCILIIILLNKYTNDPIALFVMSIFICSILEYSTSYFMEKIFKARWWDYSKKKYNINGRICLETMIPFGILGLTMMYFINPTIVSLLNHIPDVIINNIATVLFAIYIIDNIVSFNTISNFKKYSYKCLDNTEEITKKVKERLREKSFYYRRIIDAYPHMIKSLKKIRELQQRRK